MNTDFTCQTTPSCTAAEKFPGELVECEWEAAEALTCLSDPVARDHTAGEIEFSVDADDARITVCAFLIVFNFNLKSIVPISLLHRSCSSVQVRALDICNYGFNTIILTCVWYEEKYFPPSKFIEFVYLFYDIW
uniref:Putative ovule protein n=1 Tax=Solanum chacoense TaxID=4108 RepID=A0A0V0HLU5_SOLCH